MLSGNLQFDQTEQTTQTMPCNFLYAFRFPQTENVLELYGQDDNLLEVVQLFDFFGFNHTLCYNLHAEYRDNGREAYEEEFRSEIEATPKEQRPKLVKTQRPRRKQKESELKKYCKDAKKVLADKNSQTAAEEAVMLHNILYIVMQRNQFISYKDLRCYLFRCYRNLFDDSGYWLIEMLTYRKIGSFARPGVDISHMYDAHYIEQMETLVMLNMKAERLKSTIKEMTDQVVLLLCFSDSFVIHD